jgi:hypothetical protein
VYSQPPALAQRTNLAGLEESSAGDAARKDKTAADMALSRTLQLTRNEEYEILHCHISKNTWSENFF